MLNYIALSLLMTMNTQALDSEQQSTTNNEAPLKETIVAISKPVPRGNPDRWAAPYDYPIKALHKELQGTSVYLVTVSPKGRVNSCVITKSSGHTILDKTTCKVVKRRARFTPATDANGTAVIGEYSDSVDWYLPD